MQSFYRNTTTEDKKISHHSQRELKIIQQCDDKTIRHNRTDYISFSDNDYLGLSQHPDVKRAAIEAINRYGTGATASRLITGNHPIYAELESKLSQYKQTEAALVFGSGYLTNIGLISSLARKDDLIIADRLAHACILDGAQLSGARLMRFKHNNLLHCKSLLNKHRQNYRHCYLIVDHVYSMDGDVAPIADLRSLAEQFDCTLISDDAHAIGFIKPHHPDESAHIQMGTLSKALGSYGGYVCGDSDVIEHLINHARSLIYSTALPPATVAAASAALDIAMKEPERADKAMAHAKYFCNELKLAEPPSPIVPYIIGDAETALKASEILRTHGFWVNAIRPPTVPEGSSRLRFTFSTLHRHEDVKRLVSVMNAAIKPSLL